MGSPQVPSAEANGISVAYRDSGTPGEPLILINGFASTMDMWNPPLLDALSRRFRTIVFDNRGTGYSTADGAPFSIPLFAADTAALMDALWIPRARILGFSMGACIAQELALLHPERVERLVLHAGTCGGERMIMMQPAVWARLSDKSGTGMEVADRMFSVLFPEDWRANHDPWRYCPDIRETTAADTASRQAEALFRWSGSYDRLPQVRCPALVIAGADDVVIPPENSRILAGRIPGARLELVPGAGHGLQYQCPEELAKSIIRFLQDT